MDRFQIEDFRDKISGFSKTSKNIIYHKHCVIKNPKNIIASQSIINPKVVLRTDLGVIKLDPFVIIMDGTLIKPGFGQQM